MGCFNVKCGLTGTDIIHGDDVVLLFGVRRTDTDECGGWTGQRHQFHLVATPVYAKYNDYGWIEDVDKTSWDLAMKCLDITVPEEKSWTRHAADNDGDRFEQFDQFSWDATADKTDHKVLAWVHRGAWNALIAATDDPLCNDHFANIDTTNQFKIEDLLEAAKALGITQGYTSLYDTRYTGRDYHWVSLKWTSEQRFKLCDWIQSNAVIDPRAAEDAERERVRAKYAARGMADEHLDGLLDLHMSTRDYGYSDSPLYLVVISKLGGFIPYSRRLPALQRGWVKPLLKLCDENQDLFRAASQAMIGLDSARMVIRPAIDMNSAGQCSEYASDLANKAISQFVVDLSTERLRDSDED